MADTTNASRSQPGSVLAGNVWTSPIEVNAESLQDMRRNAALDVKCSEAEIHISIPAQIPGKYLVEMRMKRPEELEEGLHPAEFDQDDWVHFHAMDSERTAEVRLHSDCFHSDQMDSTVESDHTQVRFHAMVRFEAVDSELNASMMSPASSPGRTLSKGSGASKGPKESSKSSMLRQHLSTVKAEGRKRRLRISVPPFLVGMLLLLMSNLLTRLYPAPSIIFFLGQAPAPLGTVLSFIGLLPSDRRLVPFCSVVATLFMIAISYGNAVEFRKIVIVGDCSSSSLSDVVSWYCQSHGMLAACIFLVYFVGAITFIYSLRLESMKALLLFWMLANRILVLDGLLNFVKCIIAAIAGDFVVCVGFAILTVAKLSIGTLCHPYFGFRARVQSWLATRGESSVTAAGVAELLGDRDVSQVISLAKKNFVYVPANKVFESDVMYHSPDPELFNYTKKGSFGFVDAFVSHSWQDDPDAKWKCLQNWRRNFKSAHGGHEPKLWIDKYCIDQNNIDEALSSLPVYISACRKLLVLCGKTYLERLWCLVEIFVFLEMGGQFSNLEVKVLGDAVAEDLVASFDPQAARCTTDYDTHRLFEVLLASGLGLDGLRRMVQVALQCNIMS